MSTIPKLQWTIFVVCQQKVVSLNRSLLYSPVRKRPDKKILQSNIDVQYQGQISYFLISLRKKNYLSRSPFQLPLQNGRPCAPYKEVVCRKVKISKWGRARYFVLKSWESHFKRIQYFGPEKAKKNKSHFAEKELCPSEIIILNPNAFCSKGNCPSEIHILNINFIL